VYSTKLRFAALGIIVLIVIAVIVYTQVDFGSASLEGRAGMLYFYSDT